MNTPTPEELRAEQERRRLAQWLPVLDRPETDRFDRFTHLARQSCGCPVAFVAMVSDGQVWLAGRDGETLPPDHPWEASFCALPMETSHVDQVVVVRDAKEDPRLANHPYVRAGLRFYAGRAITLDEQAVGALCVADTEVRALDPFAREIIGLLARCVSLEIARRRAEVQGAEPAHRDHLTALAEQVKLEVIGRIAGD